MNCCNSLSNVQGGNFKLFSKTKFTKRFKFLLSKYIVSIFWTKHHWSVIIWGSVSFSAFQARLVISNVSKFNGHLWKCLHITIWTSVLMLLSFQFLPPSLLWDLLHSVHFKH